MRNRKIINTVFLPAEIEKYIIGRIKNIDEYLESQINIALLIKNSWYISHRPFEIAIHELINEYILRFMNKINRNVIIFIDDLSRNKNRPFDSFYAGDLIWLLGVYLNSIIEGSKLIVFRNETADRFLPYWNIFPLTNYTKNIFAVDNTNIVAEIDNYSDYDCIIYITKSLGNYCNYFDELERSYDKINNENKPSVIIWELQSCCKINPEKYTIDYIQGFTENNYKKIEGLIGLI
jgi:hypothetical protein